MEEATTPQKPTALSIESPSMLGLIAAGIALLTALVYWPSLSYTVSFTGSNVPTTVPTTPLVSWLISFLQTLCSDTACVYRAATLLLHIPAGLLLIHVVHRLLIRFTKASFASQHAQGIALIAGTFFLLHPAQAQTIAQPTLGLTECTLTLLALAMLTLVASRPNQETMPEQLVRAGGLLALTVLAALTDVRAYALPLLCACVDWTVCDDADEHAAIRYITYLASAAAALGIAYTTTGLSFALPADLLAWGTAQAIQFAYYVTTLAWPGALSVYAEPGAAQSTLYTAYAITLVLTIGTVLAWRIASMKKDPYTLALVWILGAWTSHWTLAPVTTDHRWYLVTIGTSLLAGLLYATVVELVAIALPDLQAYAPTPAARHLMATLAVANIGVLTTQYTYHWSSPLMYWANAVTHNAQSAQANQAYGTALSVERSEHTKATAHLKRAIELNPRLTESYASLANVYVRTDNVAGAMDVLADSIKTNMLYKEGYVSLANLLMRTGDNERAERLLHASLKFFENDATIHFHLARALINQKQKEKAWEHLNIACADEQVRSAAMLEAFARLSTSLGKHAQAAQTYEDMLAFVPGNVHALVAAGHAHRLAGDATQAAARYEQALALQPDFTMAQNGLAATYFDNGNYEQALAHYADLAEKQPDNTQIHMRMASCYEKLGQAEKARDVLAALTNKNLDEKEQEAEAAA